MNAGAKKHIDLAAKALKVGEEKGWTAAEALWKANKIEGASQREISDQLTDRLGPGYTHRTIGRYIKVWERFGGDARTQTFTEAYYEVRGAGDSRQGIADREVRKVARERPEVVADAIAEAPPEAQRKIADALIKAPATEKSLRNVAKRSTEPPPKLPLPKAESKLGDGVFKLWEASQLLLDETPTAEGKVRMMGQVETAKKITAALDHLLDTGELDAAFEELVEEMEQA